MGSASVCVPRVGERFLAAAGRKGGTASLSPRDGKVIIDNVRRGRSGKSCRNGTAAAPSPLSLPPDSRIKRKKDFLRLEKEGRRLYSRSFLLVAAPSASGSSRIGIAITRKIDKRAVVRNKLKRRIREIFRRNKGSLNAPYDILVVARKTALDCSFKEIERQLLGTLRHHGYLNQPVCE